MAASKDEMAARERMDRKKGTTRKALSRPACAWHPAGREFIEP
jgi:hypothetical protein